jgi:hypothetical protein
VKPSPEQPSTLNRVYEIILAAAARERRRKKGLTGPSQSEGGGDATGRNLRKGVERATS